MNMKLRFTVFLLMLLVNLTGILGRKCKGQKCKVNEESSLPVDLPRLCGDNIMIYFENICKSMWFKRRRDMGADMFVQTKHEAQDFLSFKRRKRDTDSTDVIEECCGEGCRTEELKEYC
ncbi:insulin-like peptide IlO1_i1 [Oculina patagonica]